MSDPWAKALHHYDDADDEEYAAGTADGYNAALAAVRPDYDRVVVERDDLARRLAEAEAALEALSWSVPCGCGAWRDRLNERPHAIGCPVAPYDNSVAQREENTDA